MSERGMHPEPTRFSGAILPQTRLGRIAIYLFIAFLVLSTSLSLIVGVIGGSPLLALFMIPLGVAALGGGIAALVSIFRRGERGALVFIPLIVGLVALLFVAGEVVVPH